MEPVLIGYFPKSISHEPRMQGVEEICSVSGCISPGPGGWINLWRHNDFAVYDTERLAESVVADAFQIVVEPEPAARPPWKVTLCQDPFPNGQLLAYKIFPVRYRPDGEEPIEVTGVAPEPLSDRYQRLGYDAVICEGGCYLGFGCSPLSCNGRASYLPINAHCLLENADEAHRWARKLAASGGQEGEPGSYVVIEVWRRSGPPLDRETCSSASSGIDPKLIEHAARGPLQARIQAAAEA